ncbi:MAG: zeta toxin family protein [Opitutales bacterium]
MQNRSETPRLVVVTGRAGSGKTTLAPLLAGALHMPCIARDSLKEGYVNTVGRSHAELAEDANVRVTTTFFEVVRHLLDSDISLVVEAAFQHKRWAPFLEPLIPNIRLTIIFCGTGLGCSQVCYG